LSEKINKDAGFFEKFIYDQVFKTTKMCKINQKNCWRRIFEFEREDFLSASRNPV
jgi:hypothetical protein